MRRYCDRSQSWVLYRLSQYTMGLAEHFLCTVSVAYKEEQETTQTVDSCTIYIPDYRYLADLSGKWTGQNKLLIYLYFSASHASKGIEEEKNKDMVKICTKCFLALPVTSFGKTSRKTGRLHASCKNCRKLVLQEYYKENKSKIDEKSATYAKENKHKTFVKHKNYYNNNKAKISRYRQKYYARNKDKMLARKRECYISNNSREKQNNRFKTDVQFRLSRILRSRICSAIKHNIKSGSAVSDLGCSVDFLKKHLESQFAEGMSWENWGKGENYWNIDHIMPVSAFNLEDRQHFLLACHYGNLQPLWSVDNLRKSDKVPNMENYSVGQ